MTYGVIGYRTAYTAALALGFQRLKIGGGGFVIQIDIAADGTKVHAADVFGAYWCTNANPVWTQLCTAASLGSAYANVDLQDGVRDIRIAPSNTNRFYMMFDGYMWRTDNQGTNWTQLTGFTRTSVGVNGVNGNYFGPYIAIDPINADVVYASTPSGLFRSQDAGATWTSITGVGTAVSAVGYQPGVATVFDPSSAQTGGKTQGVYAAVNGNGVWHSTDGGGTWTQLTATGMPWTFQRLACNSVGVLFLSDNGAVNGTTNAATTSGNVLHFAATPNGVAVGQSLSDQTNSRIPPSTTVSSFTSTTVTMSGSVSASLTSGSTIFFNNNAINLWSYSSGAWTNISGTNGPFTAIAIDPANSSRIVVCGNPGPIDVTTNSGGAWTGVFNGLVGNDISTDVPWLAVPNPTFKDISNLCFDPSGSNKLYCGNGIGVWWTNPPNTLTSYQWTDQSAGNEELVVNHIISPWTSGSNPIVGVWDRNAFTITNPGTYSAAQADPPDFSGGWGLDWASASPSTIVLLANWQGVDTSRVSTDGGAHWSTMANIPSTNTGGCIAASTSTNWVWTPSTGGTSLYYTTNGATSAWSTATGLPSVSWSDNYYNNRINVAADRVTANTFFAYSTGNGTYKSSNSGASWTKVNSTVFPGDGFNITLKSVPGNAGHLFFGSGEVGSPHPQSTSLYICTNGTTGAITWTALPNVKEPIAFGLGAPNPSGSGYPALFLVGWVSLDSGATYNYGIWRSDNANITTPTWTQLNTSALYPAFPMNSFDSINSIEGDANTFNKIYIGFGGTGAMVGQF